MTSHVTCTLHDLPHGRIAQVRLNRPEKLNALTLDVLEGLIATARQLRTDRQLRAVIIAGEGDSFCAGLDFASVLKKPARIIPAFTPLPWRGTNTFQEACWSWRRLPVPVIAAVHGHCLGGGVQIALGADFRFTTPDAKWAVLEGRWGIIPDMSGIQSLSELVGIDVAKKLTMTAETIDGRRAVELGLATECHDDPLAAAEEFAAKLGSRSPDAIAGAKRLFNNTWYLSPRRVFARERFEQLLLLGLKNTTRARNAAFAKSEPSYGPRVLP